MTPDLRLLPDETVLLVTRRHPIVLVASLLLLLLALLLILTQACPAAIEMELDGSCPVLAGFALALVATLLAIDWLTTHFVLTDRRLLKLQAPAWRRAESLPLEVIQTLTLDVGLLGRLFGYGQVLADTAATEGGRLRLDYAPRPENLRDRIAAAMVPLASGPDEE